MKTTFAFPIALSVLSSVLLSAFAEVPSSGAKAGEWFQEGNKGNVIGKNPAEGLKVKKDGGDVDAISGSTITSRAFCEIINNAYAIYQKGGNEQ